MSIIKPMYAKGSSTVMGCQVVNSSPLHSCAYLLLSVTMCSRTEDVKNKKKISLTTVGMSTRGPVGRVNGCI